MQWQTPGYEDLELSTQLVIQEALRRQHSVEVLDRSSNFIRIRGNGHIEYLRQATCTSADRYVNPLIMENKKVTKILLKEAGIRVPNGKDYTDLAQVQQDYAQWKLAGAVVKPNRTNFGIAVSLLPAPITEIEYQRAAREALEKDDTILVEELIHWKEYRFLVIGDAVRGILHRVPARVVGDGHHTIWELVDRKNADPMRGKGYHSPLEKIQTGAEEANYLQTQGLAFDTVIENGREVFLRKNSNISTGGDSLDFTDQIRPEYGELAVASAAAVGARICGVDLLIKDIEAVPNSSNYAVIELNFNPALHIHDYPYQGQNRAVERHVLDLLGL